MLGDDQIVRRTNRPHIGRQHVYTREAERILGACRSVVIRLARTGALPGKLIDKPGAGRRWVFELSDVLRVKQDGKALWCTPRLRRIRVAWVKAFGTIPRGFAVIARDGDQANAAPSNLALAPLKEHIKNLRSQRGRRIRSLPVRWTRTMNARLRREYAGGRTEKLAQDFAVSIQALRCQARRLRLRKSIDYIIARAREGKRYPIGTERLCTADKVKGIVLVKVSYIGKRSQQWRPKHHLIWEQAHGRPVPTGFRVYFKDGNKTNFDPSNLDLATRGELAALAFARFLSYPPPVQEAIRLERGLHREIARQRLGVERPARTIRGGDRHGRKRRWTASMDKVLRCEYPEGRLKDVTAALGVSLAAVRVRAQRLGVRRSPEAIIAQAREVAAFQKTHQTHLLA